MAILLEDLENCYKLKSVEEFKKTVEKIDDINFTRFLTRRIADLEEGSSGGGKDDVAITLRVHQAVKPCYIEQALESKLGRWDEQFWISHTVCTAAGLGNKKILQEWIDKGCSEWCTRNALFSCLLGTAEIQVQLECLKVILESKNFPISVLSSKGKNIFKYVLDVSGNKCNATIEMLLEKAGNRLALNVPWRKNGGCLREKLQRFDSPVVTNCLATQNLDSEHLPELLNALWDDNEDVFHKLFVHYNQDCRFLLYWASEKCLPTACKAILKKMRDQRTHNQTKYTLYDFRVSMTAIIKGKTGKVGQKLRCLQEYDRFLRNWFGDDFLKNLDKIEECARGQYLKGFLPDEIKIINQYLRTKTGEPVIKSFIVKRIWRLLLDDSLYCDEEKLYILKDFSRENELSQFLIDRVGNLLQQCVSDRIVLINSNSCMRNQFLDSLCTYDEKKNECILDYTKLSSDSTFNSNDWLYSMANESELKSMVQHPVLKCLIDKKWENFKWLYHLNLFCYLFYFGSLIAFIVEHIQQDPSFITLWLIVSSTILLFFREFVQFLIKRASYFYHLENWLELTIILLTVLTVFSDAYRPKYPHKIATIILLAAASLELFLLCGKHPFFSKKVETMKEVTKTFATNLDLVSFFVLIFSLFFYIMFYQNDKSENKSVFQSFEQVLFKVIVMISGEFDAGDENSMPFFYFPVVSQIMFTLFVFLITIVLMNLLVGLAVSDVRKIQDDALILAYRARVKFVSLAETILEKLRSVTPSLIQCIRKDAHINKLKIKTKVTKEDSVGEDIFIVSENVFSKLKKIGTKTAKYNESNGRRRNLVEEDTAKGDCWVLTTDLHKLEKALKGEIEEMKIKLSEIVTILKDSGQRIE